jgi:flagellar protein FlaG
MLPATPSLAVGSAASVGAEGRLNAQASYGAVDAQSTGGGKVVALPRGVQGTSDQQQASNQQDKDGKDGKDGKDDLTKAVNQMNDSTELLRSNLKFSIDKESGRTVIKVVDSKTDEVIRQIPREEVLAIARSLEKAEGLLFRAKA